MSFQQFPINEDASIVINTKVRVPAATTIKWWDMALLAPSESD